MFDLVWILSSEKSASFGNKGIFASYIIPKNDMKVELQMLAGNRLWVVLRGPEDRLLKLIKIKKVEQIIDGYHAGDFLVSTELAESFKLVSSYSMAAKCKVPNTRALNLGVSELDLQTSLSLHMLVKEMMQIKLISPTEQLLRQINLTLLPNNSHQLVSNALRAVISRLTLDQIWANGTGEKLGAFSNFAFALISSKINIKQAPDLLEELRNLDPVSILLNKRKLQAHDDLANTRKLPRIDIEFTLIEPQNIYARKFLFIDSKFNYLEDALNKTEHAEKIHQEMLKDISMFLIDHGVTPYESSSIDLMYSTGNKLNVFEIKSTNINNILAQAAKGAFQLACYLNELRKNYNNILNTKLILHKTENQGLDEYAREALSCLNIHVLFYDPSKPWPARVHGLPLLSDT